MFEQLKTRIATLGPTLQAGYAGHQDEVRAIARDVRAAIDAEFGQVPLWERDELAAAEDFAARNWLMASLHAAHKAIVVSELPDDEYWGGYTYTHRTVKPSPRRIRR